MKIQQILYIVVLILLKITSVNAAPVYFDLAGAPSSSVAVSSFNSGGFLCSFTNCGIDVLLDSNLNNQQNTLAVGDSWTIPFFDLSFHGLGGGTGTIAATLGFDDPTGTPGSSAVGGGGFFTFFGIVSGGNLNWGTQPGLTTLADGTSFDVTFENLTGIAIASSTVHATITLRSEASIPEPELFLLLGLAFLGLSLTRLTKQTHTYG